MTVALNVFKTYTADLTVTSTTVYTAPAGYTSIVLLAQISNITEATISVTADFVRDEAVTNIIKNGAIPKHDSLTVVSGKLVLQSGDQLNALASDSAQMIVSVIESVNP
jgi:hypothetical protein